MQFSPQGGNGTVFAPSDVVRVTGVEPARLTLSLIHISFNGDSLLINLLTIAFVFIILIFTFRSVVGAALLVFVIQGSIWINFTFPYLTHTRASFVTNMIVSAIQMGATIDYAIVIMSRYLDLKKLHTPQEAMAQAVNESFPTVMTSGTIMTVAGILIA